MAKEEVTATGDLGSVSQFEGEENKVRDGIWFGKDTFRPNRDGTVPEFLIRPADRDLNASYGESLILWRRKNPRLADKDDDNTQIKTLKFCFMRSCLVNWRNFQDREGKDIPFNRNNMVLYMNKLPILFRKLLSVALDDGRYMKSEVDDLLGE